jgi:hypothetical protein
MIDVDWWADISMIGSVSTEKGPPLTEGKPQATRASLVDNVTASAAADKAAGKRAGTYFSAEGVSTEDLALTEGMFPTRSSL